MGELGSLKHVANLVIRASMVSVLNKHGEWASLLGGTLDPSCWSDDEDSDECQEDEEDYAEDEEALVINEDGGEEEREDGNGNEKIQLFSLGTRHTAQGKRRSSTPLASSKIFHQDNATSPSHNNALCSSPIRHREKSRRLVNFHGGSIGENQRPD